MPSALRDAQERAAKGELAVRSKRPGRAQPARRVGRLEGGQWREKGHRLGHSGDAASWANPGRGVARWPGARLVRLPCAPLSSTPGGCGHDGPDSAPRRPEQPQPGTVRRGAPTCFAANRRSGLIQREPLTGAATPPPLARDKASSVALSDWALPVFYRSVVLVWSSAKK